MVCGEMMECFNMAKTLYEKTWDAPRVGAIADVRTF